jgi:quercetin dioxygenase-like cupin family protein
MLKKAVRLAVVVSAIAAAPAVGQAQAPAAPAPTASAPVPAGQTPDPAAPSTAKPAGGGQKVGQTGNPDPGVNFLNVVENPHVRVLQVTLQPGAVRRPHVHNDVTFHMLVPITGALELTIEKEPVITAVPGQAYYMVKGQTHSFTNKTAAAVQVIELFIKPEPVAAPATPAPTPAPAAAPTPAPASAPASAPAPAPAPAP